MCGSFNKVCNDQVNVGAQYQGTIHALHSVPKGTCKGTASVAGPHPYTCEACETLQHGKNRQLLHKLLRAPKLKHPHSEHNRASHRGVSQKHCSKSDLEVALQSRKMQADTQSECMASLSKANQKLLSES